jgi:RHS repeat-associated protein
LAYDSATVNGLSMTNAKARLAEAYTCITPCTSKITDEGFSYSLRGEVSDVYLSTPHSGGYYHINQTYWPHGAPLQLSQLAGLPTISIGGTIGSTVGIDGEGRITQVTASSGQNPVTGVSYNNASLPTQVNFGSGDSDLFAYDSNTLRMTQYKFNVNGQSAFGALNWNANATLQRLAITDPFNSAGNQACSYIHDDQTRLQSVDCGMSWSQTFSYDPFGNLKKSGTTSFQPTYSASTNRMISLPGGFTPTYDSNGNVTNDSLHTYAWDANGRPVTIDGVGVTYDALGRMVEQNRSGTYTEIVYGTSGQKIALMSGQTLQKAFVSLPGGSLAVYTGSGLDHYRHSDWLGSARVTTTPSRAVSGDIAYAPYGETYAQSGTPDASFTGINQDTVPNEYDFPAREYGIQGRWASPDPMGFGAVSLADPQSWNRYAYVRNSPFSFVDPSGLCADPTNTSITVCADPINFDPSGSGFGPWITGFPNGGSMGGGRGYRDPIFRCIDRASHHEFSISQCFPGGQTAGASGAKPTKTMEECVSDFKSTNVGKTTNFFDPLNVLPWMNSNWKKSALEWVGLGSAKILTFKSVQAVVSRNPLGALDSYSITTGAVASTASPTGAVLEGTETVSGYIAPVIWTAAAFVDLAVISRCSSLYGPLPTEVVPGP